MKKTTALLLVLVLLAGTAAAVTGNEIKTKLESGSPGRFRLQSAAIRIDKLPASVDEFVQLRNRIAVTPEGGYALFVIAMLTWEKNRDLARKFFVIALDRGQLHRSGSPWHRGYAPGSSLTYHLNRLQRQPWLPKIFFTGTTPANGYKLPDPPLEIRFRQLTVYKAGDVSLYAFTTSGNMARPIRLKKNNRGYWKAWSFSSLFVGVARPPQNNAGSDDDI